MELIVKKMSKLEKFLGYKGYKDTKVLLALAYWRHGTQTKLQCNNIQKLTINL